MFIFRTIKNFSFLTNKIRVTSASVREYCEETLDTDIHDFKDRSKEIDVETSIRYLKSSAYQKTYGNDFIWQLYRRNFKGNLPPKTRKTCIRNHKISTGSPCPICRDIYLVIHHKNVDLLNQFISPYGGEVYPSKKTGVCQKQQRKLIVEIQKAWNCGLITYDVPHRSYNYSLYY